MHNQCIEKIAHVNDNVFKSVKEISNIFLITMQSNQNPNKYKIYNKINIKC